MADVNTSILTALEAGYDPQEIMDHIKKSEDPLHQEWYSNYAANMADRSKEQSVGSIYYNDGSGVQTTDQIGTSPTVKPTSTTTPVLDWAQTLTPVEAGAVVAGTVGVAKAPGLINAYQERKIKREELAQKERSLAAYEAQVAKQGMVGQPAGAPMSTEPPPLSPYEQARIETERARADLIRSKIAQTERESAAREAKAKADAERKAANVPTPKAKEPVIQLNAGTTGVAPTGAPMPVGPTPANPSAPLTTEVGPPPKDMGIVKAGTENTIKNLIAEEIKPAPAIAATPPEIAPMAIEPSTATTEVTPTKAVETPEQIAAKKEATTKAVLGAGEKGAEPWIKGTLGAKNNPARATNLVEHLKSTLPEGQKLAFPIGEDGKSLGGMPSKQHVIKFTNDLLGTSMDEKAFKEFRFTEENLKKMAQTLEEKIKNAPTPEAANNLQKGFSTIVAMASVAGVTLAGLAIYGAYKKAKAGEYKEAAKLGIPAATGLISPGIGGLTGAAAEPQAYAEELRRMSPILGTFAGLAQSKLDQFRNKKPVPPPR